MTPYNRPHLSYAAQSELLHERGLTVNDPAAAVIALERIGYYRLQPYWAALQMSDQQFHNDAHFSHAYDLYVFDKKLRLLMLDANERIEVAVRVKIAHALGKRDQWAHRKVGCLDTMRCRKGKHDDWLTHTDASTAESQEAWVAEHIRQHGEPLPIWKAIETWSFGEVSKLYGLLHVNDRSSISKSLGLKPDTLGSWLRCLVLVRNICAHHSRLWNKPLVNQPQVPDSWEARTVQHIGEHTLYQTRLYASAAISAYFLTIINPKSSWKTRLMEHIQSFPVIPYLTLSHSGFHENWHDRDLWTANSAP